MNDRPELFVKIISSDPDVIKYYMDEAKKVNSINNTDSGFDLIITDDINESCDINKEYNKRPYNKTTLLGLGIQCAPNFNSGYYLNTRSSIYKTNLRLANNIGIIDQTYRGEIKAVVDIYGEVMIKKGTRLFQLCHPSLKPMKITIVDSLDKTERNEGGFGSTGY